MTETITRPTEMVVESFIDAVEHPIRRADAATILALMARVTGETPRMWGPSIIGFGHYAYRYDSGHSGESCRIGFSPRKANLVLYILTGFDGETAQLAALGKHKAGKGCLYINKLADVDMGVLEAMIADAWADMARRYSA